MTEEPTTPLQDYIARIEKLDTGDLAALRRGCGARDPIEGRCPWLHGVIHGAAPEPLAFLVASLLAQHSTASIKSGGHRAKGSFGSTWRRACAMKDSESLKRRFHILLDADYNPRTGEGDLPYRLRQMVRYAASQGVGVDWPQLLADLRRWDHPARLSQKDWARSFFAKEEPDVSDDKNDTKETKETDNAD